MLILLLLEGTNREMRNVLKKLEKAFLKFEQSGDPVVNSVALILAVLGATVLIKWMQGAM